MKFKFRRYSKSLASVFLTLSMLASCVTISVFPTGAAVVGDDESVGGAGSTTGNWYLSNSIQNTWDNTSAYQMTRASGTDYYRDFYFQKTDSSSLTFRFWSAADNDKLGAYFGDKTAITTSGDIGSNDKGHSSQGVWGWNNTWEFKPSTQISNSGFYRIRIHLSPAAGYTGDWYEYNETRYFSGRTWYSADSLGSLSPTIVTQSGSEDTDTFTNTETVNVSATSSNNVGTVTYSYQYKYGSGSYQNITNNQFSPTEPGTYTIKVTATDGGVIASGTGQNAFSTRTETATKTITVLDPRTDLPKPTVSFSSSTVTASTSGSVTLSVTNHSDIDANGTYKLFYNQSSATGTYSEVNVASDNDISYSNGVFTIAAKYSKRGYYKVQAIARDSTQYIDSVQSDYAQLTVNRTKLSAPTVAVSSTDIYVGQSVNLTATDTNTGVASARFAYYYYTGSTPTISNDYKLTAGTPKVLSPTADVTYKVIAYPTGGVSDEYYTQSNAASATEVKVYPAVDKKIVGSLVGTATGQWSYANGVDFTTYLGQGVYKYVTTKQGQGTYHFKLYDASDKGYSGSTDTSSNLSVTLGTEYTLYENSATAFEIVGAGGFEIYYDVPNNKVRVETNTWIVNPYAYTQTFNIESDTYNTPAENTTGGTVSPSTQTLVDKTHSQTLTATAKTGYTFVGWYSSTDFSAVPASTAASFTFTPTADVSYYALFREDSPTHYTVSVPDTDNATVTATYAGRTAYEGGTISVPAGAHVTISAVADTGAGVTSVAVTPTTGTAPTITNNRFVMPACNVTINVTAVMNDYTIKVVKNPAVVTDANVTAKAVNESGTDINAVQYNQKYRIKVQYKHGYEIASITGVPEGTVINDTASTASSDGVYIVEYTMGTANVTATVNLKAKDPTITGVQIKDRTEENFGYKSFGACLDGSVIVNHYYKQQINAMASTDDYPNSSILFTAKKGGSTIGTASASPASINADNNIRPAAEEGYVDYTLEIKATNAPSGVTATELTYKYTIRVTYNEAQKKYFKLLELYNRCGGAEAVNSNPYFENDAPIQAFNTAYGNAAAYITNKGWPDYDAGSSVAAEVEAVYNGLLAAYNNLMMKAKPSTVYILTKYQNSDSKPVYLTASSNDNPDDWKHFNMKDYGSSKVSADTFRMRYEGKFQKDGDRYLYSFTYTGHISFFVWVDYDNSHSLESEKLTASVTGITNFGKYYINAYNTEKTSSPTINSAVNYVDFGHTKNTKKVFVELGESKTRAQLLDTTMLNIKASSSLINDPGITVTNTKFDIDGPVGSETPQHYDMNAENATFPASAQGRYTVTYTTEFGVDADGKKTKSHTLVMSLWVAYDDVSIYIDMNDNVGTPVLNLKYYLNSEGKPTYKGSSGATVAYLPYEMDLVTGSESVYKYTIKLSRLRKDYKIAVAWDSEHNKEVKTALDISYITVENEYVTTAGRSRTKPTENDTHAFVIPDDARASGEVWYKANSTNFTNIDVISYGSVTNSFAAIIDSDPIVSYGRKTYDVLASAVKKVNGTGIVTDDNDIYSVKYASFEPDDNLPKFSYVQKTVLNEEVAAGGTKYYFDKWLVYDADDADVLVITDPTTLAETVMLSLNDDAGTQYSESPDLNFLAAPEFAGGDKTYVAVYKPVSQSSEDVRVEITYEFEDYNTSDGNYAYDPIKSTETASYTKTVKVRDTLANVESNLADIAQDNMPIVKSNYFDYAWDGIVADTKTVVQADNKISVKAKLEETARLYSVTASYDPTNVKELTGYYQQSVNLSKSDSELNAAGVVHPKWVDSASGQVISTSDTCSIKFVEDNATITLSDDSEASVEHTSVVSNSFNEIYYQDDTEMVRHNFYIIDYCGQGEFVGGGVIFATADANGFRQTAAQTAFEAPGTYIGNILNPSGTATNVDNFETEYKIQTIGNVGFRYKPFSDTEDVFRYSSDLKAYTNMFEGTNVNSDKYDGQTLRLKSFMVYMSNGEYVIVVSNNYAEISRYQPQS